VEVKAMPVAASITRRRLVTSSLAMVAGATLPRWVMAGTGGGDPRFVVIVLRGGLDGMAAVPPHGDPAYRDLRPTLALPEPGAVQGILDLDGFFGLHPALTGMHALHAEGALAVVHAAASHYRSRSHFDGQNVLETAAARPYGLHDGWLNRALAGLHADGTTRGLAIGLAPPLVLQGQVRVASWYPSRTPDPPADLLALVQDLYASDALLGPALEQGLRTRALARGAEIKARDKADLESLAHAAGVLLAAPDGPRVATIEKDGWDSHAVQGSVDGKLAQRLGGLDRSLLELRRGLGEAWRHTLVLVVTEFGRTVRENGTGGTDHGTAGVAFVAGGAVLGGRVLADWPGLSDGDLHEGRDLRPTLDLRSVFKAALVDHLALDPAFVETTVFPASAEAKPLAGLLRA